MVAFRIRKRIDDETLHLPELRPLIGKEVEIIVQTPDIATDFWHPLSLDELAARQGKQGPTSVAEITGSFSIADFEGFEQKRREWRAEENGRRS